MQIPTSFTAEKKLELGLAAFKVFLSVQHILFREPNLVTNETRTQLALYELLCVGKVQQFGRHKSLGITHLCIKQVVPHFFFACLFTNLPKECEQCYYPSPKAIYMGSGGNYINS